MGLLSTSSSLLAKKHSTTGNAKFSKKASNFFDMDRVGCIILGGGQGTRLYPLTETRCKPAICFGGRYRLIDVPLSNSLNSHCQKIFIVTQFLSSTLHRHISHTYHHQSFSNGFIDILAAEQKPTAKGWFQGTADAVRQNLEYFVEVPVDYFLILSGDQLYNIDFRAMVNFAQEKDADLVIASIPVNETDAKRMGILKVDDNDQIIDFYEKPKEVELLEKMRSSAKSLERAKVNSESGKQHLGSMGIYLFKREALIKLLAEDPRDDFGQHLIPTKVKQGSTFAFLYDGYWEDIGTIETFYKANIALALDNPPFDCYNETNPIYTSQYNLPGSKITNTKMEQTIICEGSIIEADEVTKSILGPRTVIRKGTKVTESYLMGNDFYKPPIRDTKRLPEFLEIGENCTIRNSIIDKDVYIGNNVQLINKNQLRHYDGQNIFIRDGIIIVTRGASVLDNFVL